MTDIDKLPVTVGGVEAFLSGDMVSGIGPVYARRLVETYGPEVVSRLADNPASVTDIPGLGHSKLEKASESILALKHPLSLLLFLYSTGIPGLYIERILDRYRKRTAEIVTTDPYGMIEDVWRLSFPIADKIGRLLGIADNDPRRLRGALLTAVKNYAEDGHLFATPEQAVAEAVRLSKASPDEIRALIPSLTADGRLVESHGGLYLPVFYEAERNGARRLMDLSAAEVSPVDIDEVPSHDIEGHLYTTAQRRAIATAMSHPVMVLTGGPGSGKTTVLKGILDILQSRGMKAILAAPTGRAAKRMSTLTGVEAQTIHRLLGYRQGEGYRNKTIDTDVLIIDEGSMMEQVLFDHLLEAVRPGTRIIVVGDVDQLPAIGAGDVLRNLIDSRTVPVVRLDENFRQIGGSAIAASARAINSGNVPSPAGARDFMIVNEQGPAAIHSRLMSLVADELPARHGIRPSDIQVVTPQQLGPLGARQLNKDLQARLNPEGPEIRRLTTVMRLGDPVMQTANSRERGVYNGEIGRICEVVPDLGQLTVEFSDGRRSTYTGIELSELTLAYATTVHKLQGSEVRYMVMPVTMAHRPMLYRNLLYTGVSRARDLCVLVGEPDALRYAVDNAPQHTRNSNFTHRLRRHASRKHPA
ncbi:MAG: AAA family ATPase [Muribaculaceae bacterium]|nr:AAA family ATPase [Muribaculaceae bacterium]